MLKRDWNYRRGDIYLIDLGEHRGNIQAESGQSSIFRTTAATSSDRH